MTLRKAAMTIWKKTVLKKKKASTNSSLSVKSLGYQLVMNLQPCATAFCIAKTSTLNICYLSSLSGLSMCVAALICSITWLLKCWPPRSAELLLVICLSYVRTLQIWDSAKCLPKGGPPQLFRYEPLLYSYWLCWNMNKLLDYYHRGLVWYKPEIWPKLRPLIDWELKI